MKNFVNLSARKNEDIPSLTITDDSKELYTARYRSRESEATLVFSISLI